MAQWQDQGLSKSKDLGSIPTTVGKMTTASATEIMNTHEPGMIVVNKAYFATRLKIGSSDGYRFRRLIIDTGNGKPWNERTIEEYVGRMRDAVGIAALCVGNIRWETSFRPWWATDDSHKHVAVYYCDDYESPLDAEAETDPIILLNGSFQVLHNNCFWHLPKDKRQRVEMQVMRLVGDRHYPGRNKERGVQ